MVMTGQILRDFLESRGWNFDIGRRAWVKGDPRWPSSMLVAQSDQHARDLQRGIDAEAEECRWRKRPSYHWGLDIALALGRPA